MRKTIFAVKKESFQLENINPSCKRLTKDEIIDMLLDEQDHEPETVGRFDTMEEAVSVLNAQNVYTDRVSCQPSGFMLTGMIAYVEGIIMEKDVDGDWNVVDWGDIWRIRAEGWEKGISFREECAFERLSKTYSAEILDAAKELYADLNLCDEEEAFQCIESDDEHGYFTVNRCRNGREVVWYNDGADEKCIYVDNRTELDADEIQKELL